MCAVLTLFQELDKCFIYIVSTVLCRGDRASESPGSQSQWMFSDSNTFYFFLLLHQSILQRYEPERVIVADMPPSHTSQDVLGKQHLRTTEHIIQSNLSANLGFQRACRWGLRNAILSCQSLSFRYHCDLSWRFYISPYVWPFSHADRLTSWLREGSSPCVLHTPEQGKSKHLFYLLNSSFDICSMLFFSGGQRQVRGSLGHFVRIFL